jgi:hypothetical protein
MVTLLVACVGCSFAGLIALPLVRIVTSPRQVRAAIKKQAIALG